MFHHVLVPLDGSPQADEILPYVIWFAKRLNLPVTVLSVTDGQGGASPGPMPEEGAQHLRTSMHRLMREGVQAAPAVGVGRPAQEILRIADDRGCDLIVLSTSTGRPRVGGSLGPVADRVFHASHIPLLLIPPHSATTATREHPLTALILPLDGSPLAESALPYAEDLAQRLSTAMVVVRSVAFPGVYIDEKTPLTGEIEATIYLRSVADRLRGEGVAVETKIFGGLPVPHILALAQQIPDSLVVLTTHGRSALTRWFVGSVAEGVVRAAEVPVLVIPRQFSRRYVERVAELLAHTSLFAELSQDDLEHLAETARIRTYHRGEIIVREGETATGCFTIASGRVEVVRGADGLHPMALGALGAGEFFGEMAIIDDHPRSATVRAIEETECVAIRREDFLDTLQHRPQIAVRMLPVLVRRLRQADARATE
jgi:nucleotide-binding universal stress UspA family protein